MSHSILAATAPSRWACSHPIPPRWHSAPGCWAASSRCFSTAGAATCRCGVHSTRWRLVLPSSVLPLVRQIWPAARRLVRRLSCPRSLFDGLNFLLVIALSAAARVFLEAFRGDSWIISGGLRGAQVVGLAILALCLAALRHLGGRACVPDRALAETA